MNTIDVTTITQVKYDTTGNGDWDTFDVSIAPGDLNTGHFRNLFKARYVRVIENWIDLASSAPPVGGEAQNVLVKYGTQESDTTVPHDTNEIAYLGKWGFFFPEGEYYFDDIIVQNDIFLIGAGRKTIFKSKWIRNNANTTVNPDDFNDRYSFQQPTGFFLESAIFENITFEDTKCLQLNANEVIIRNCRFYNMSEGGIGAFKKSKFLLIENCFVGFNPDPDMPRGAYYVSGGVLIRDADYSCISMGISALAISGGGQRNITIRNNYFENTRDNAIAVRGQLATNINNVKTSGIVQIQIHNNEVYKAGKAGIKLTYENNSTTNNLGIPYGNFSCSVVGNHIREWGIKVSEAAISCDNDAIYNPEHFTYEIARVPLEGGENEGEDPNQEITQPLTPIDYPEGGPGEYDYNETLAASGDLVPVQRNSFSNALVVQGNLIIGSGRSRDGDNDEKRRRREAYGITARKWKNIVISNNIITGTPVYINSDYADIHFNTGSTVYSGIQLRECFHFVISSNVIENSVYVYVKSGNEENQDRGGIKLIGCQFGNINSNTIKNPGIATRREPNDPIKWSQGILLFKSRFCNITGNNISCYAPRYLQSDQGELVPIIFTSIEYAVKETPIVVDNISLRFTRCAENQISGNKVFNIMNTPAYLVTVTNTVNFGALDGLYGAISDSDII